MSKILLAVASLVGAGLALLYMSVDVPAANGSAAIQRNVYRYADGTLLATEGAVNRENVPLSHVPRNVQRAVLAAEDRQFFREGAIDIRAMARGIYRTVQGGGKQSGSTITQQYVKNYYLDQKQTVTRKIREVFISMKVDRRMSKNKILEGYLNTSYFGRNSYGIQAAAQNYFGKNVKSLTVAEGAYLAALLKAPSAYDIGSYPQNREKVERRWRYVLDGMVDERWLTPEERVRLDFPRNILLKYSPPGLSGQRGYVVQAVKQYLYGAGIVTEEDLGAGGYTITTTIDRVRQNALSQAVSTQLLSRLRPDREQDAWVRAAAASIDPVSGRTVALYGGTDASRQYVNGATTRDYQAGSLFKPLVLAAALDNGSLTQNGEPITPDTLYDGTSRRTVLGLPPGVSYAPSNEDDRSFGDVTVQTAMQQSVNSVFAQMATDVGPRTVGSTAVALGIPHAVFPADSGPAIGLGSVEASALDMAQAYATLAHRGARSPNRLVDSVTKGSMVIALPQEAPVQAISAEAADITTGVLRQVIEKGSGAVARALGRPAAGKTGTAEEDRAAWFAGYTAELATVVVVQGRDSTTGVPQSLYGAAGEERVNGGDLPAAIWTDYTRKALSPPER